MNSRAKEHNETPNTKSLIIGWREWVAFPNLGIDSIKAKIDTGAQTSALHAFDIEEYVSQGKEMVRFKIHPVQRNNRYLINAAAPILEKRWVKSSVGHRTLRPVITTTLQMGPYEWDIELTLVNRDQMGFRMLLGREAFRSFILVQPTKSFLLEK